VTNEYLALIAEVKSEQSGRQKFPRSTHICLSWLEIPHLLHFTSMTPASVAPTSGQKRTLTRFHDTWINNIPDLGNFTPFGYESKHYFGHFSTFVEKCDIFPTIVEKLSRMHSVWYDHWSTLLASSRKNFAPATVTQRLPVKLQDLPHKKLCSVAGKTSHIVSVGDVITKLACYMLAYYMEDIFTKYHWSLPWKS